MGRERLRVRRRRPMRRPGGGSPRPSRRCREPAWRTWAVSAYFRAPPPLPMSLHLTGDVTRRLGAVTDALLSPLQWPTVDAWWRHVEPRLLELFPGATGMLSIAGPGGMGHYSDSVDAAHRRTMTEMTRLDPDTGLLFHDDEPTERWIRWRRARRLPVWGQPMNEVHLNDLGTDISQCAWYHDGLVPARLRDFVGMTVDGPRGETYVCIGYQRKGGSRLGFEAEHTLFELLFPAVRAA